MIKDLSPNIFRSGLWSTAIVRFLHPRTKCLEASAYLDSAACVNLLPTRVILQLCLQQNRSLEGQEQQQPITDAMFRPVSGQARAFGFVKDFDSILIFVDDG